MRILRLEIEAFGPFSERQKIDFESAEDSGLLLISGQTGAGKSSLLDAICFALYGRVPRYDGAPERVRSDYAQATQQTEVLLDIRLGDRDYRIQRSPKWDKLRENGETTTVQQSAKLWSRRASSKHWEGQASRVRDVAEQLHDVLPLNVEQFLQVILLAQGGFQKFLQAEPAERQKTLQSLFHTRIYERVEDVLDEQRQDIEKSAGREEAIAQSHLEQIEDALESDSDALLSRTGDGRQHEREGDDPRTVLERRDQARAVHAELEGELNRRAEALRADKKRLEELTQEFEHAQKIDDAFTRYERARSELRELEAGADETNQLRQELAAAQRANLVMPTLAQCERIENKRDAAADKTRDLHERAKTALRVITDTTEQEDVPHDLQVYDLDSLRTIQRSLQHTCGVLEPLSQAHSEYERARQKTQTTREFAKELAKQLSEIEDQLGAAPLTLKKLRTEREENVERSAKLEAATLRQTELRAQRQAQDELRDLLEQEEQFETEYQQLVKKVASANAALSTLLEKRLDQNAGQLAENLTAGQPCPVCGATEHPAPAKNLAPVTDEEIADAEQAARQLEHRRDTTDEKLRKSQRLCAAKRVQAGELPTQELATRLADAEHEVAVSQQATAKVQSLSARITEQEQQASTLETRKREIAAEHQETQNTLASLTAQEQSLREELHSAKGTWPSVSDRLEALTGLSTAIDSLISACVRQEELDAQVQDMRSSVVAALTQHGFENVAEVKQCALEQTAVEAKQQRVQNHDERRRVAQLTLEEPELQQLPEHRPDVAAKQQARSAAATHVEACHAEQYAIRDRLAARADQLDRLDGMLEQNSKEAQKLLDLKQLSETLKGREPNTKRMKLEAFVLAGRLETIIHAANRRLNDVDDGRFQLELDDSLQARRKQSGLGIQVFDAYTGKSRSTASLSGGETFLVSLSLALGLADVVTSEAGGLNLDTLFIDEGFGSLDPDALEDALAMLDELREGGRTVAIISHVREMHERIPRQLSVQATSHGPSYLVGDAASQLMHTEQQEQI